MKKTFYKIYKFVILFSILWIYGKTFVDIFIGDKLAKLFHMATEGETMSILKNGCLILLVLAFYSLLSFLVNKSLELSKQRSKESIKLYIYKALMNTPYVVLEKRTFGEISNRLDKDADKFINGFCNSFVVVIASTLGALTYFLYLSSINITLALINVFVSLLLIIPPMIFKGRFHNYYEEYSSLEENLRDTVNSSIEGYEFLKLHGKYDYFYDKADDSFNKMESLGYDLEKAGIVEGSLGDGLSNVAKITLYGFIAYFILKDAIFLSHGVQWMFLGKYLISNISNIFNEYKNFQNAFISLKRIEEVFSSEKESKGFPISSLESIEFKNVSFSYENKPCLNKISFKVDKGDKLIIQGENGSGKSTILKLLLGVYENFSGEILINNTPINEINKSTLRKNISLISQNQFFLLGTPLENASLFNKDSKDIKLFMDKLSLKDDDMNKVSCNHLSGGQRQKLSLIRAMIKDSDFIIMDEPTNYLDKSSIEELKLLIKELNKTLIVITHDPNIKELFHKELNLTTLKEVI